MFRLTEPVEISRWVFSKEQSGTTEGVNMECPKNTPLHREMKAERLSSTG
jgi:hypothetical protein